MAYHTLTAGVASSSIVVPAILFANDPENLKPDLPRKDWINVRRALGFVYPDFSLPCFSLTSN